ncbi:MAG: thioesterase family protein [Alistipes sp.]
MLEKGLSARSTTTVSAANTAVEMGSGDLPVFATPAMVALMENAAMTAVASVLPTGQTTVGAEMNVTHIKPSALGTAITATAVLLEVDGRKLTFNVGARDPQGMIGEGIHIRYIVDREKFLAKIAPAL